MTIIQTEDTGMGESEIVLEIGEVQWHSSEEGGGPDVGIAIGLDQGRELWIGERLDRDGGGWGIVLYEHDGSRPIDLQDHDELRGLFEYEIAPLMRGACKSTGTEGSIVNPMHSMGESEITQVEARTVWHEALAAANDGIAFKPAADARAMTVVEMYLARVHAQARQEALEEAAKVAESPAYGLAPHKSVKIATAIRSLNSNKGGE